MKYLSKGIGCNAVPWFRVYGSNTFPKMKYKLGFYEHRWIKKSRGLNSVFTIHRYYGPIHTETFSCVFLLFTVLKGIENNQLITLNNTKTQENVSVCTGPIYRHATDFVEQATRADVLL